MSSDATDRIGKRVYSKPRLKYMKPRLTRFGKLTDVTKQGGFGPFSPGPNSIEEQLRREREGRG